MVEPLVIIELRLLLLSADPIELVSAPVVVPLGAGPPPGSDLLPIVGVAMLGGRERRFSFSTSERSGRLGCNSSVSSNTGSELVGVVAFETAVTVLFDKRLTAPPLSLSEETMLELCSLAVDMGLV